MNEITIELNQQEYTGGHMIAGEVIVRLDQDTPLRGIRLMLKGYEKASWREGSGKQRHTHSGTHNFFDEQVTLHGRPRLGLGELVADSVKGVFSKEHYEVLRAGSYRYPFSYVLPPDLPGNYESAQTNSRIYYGLKAQVDLPLKFDLQAERPLVVYEPANPAAVQAVTQRLTKKFLFDSDSLVEAAVHLDKDTFAVGEVLHCQLEVTNRAPTKEIHAATLALRQIETLEADGRTHEGKTEIVRSRFEECRFPLKERTRVDLDLDLPGDLCPTIALGSLVKLHYELQVTLDIPWAVDAKLSAPIKLVPRRESAEQGGP
jgi:hypothetical protein